MVKVYLITKGASGVAYYAHTDKEETRKVYNQDYKDADESYFIETWIDGVFDSVERQ